MLTDEQIQALKEYATRITDSVQSYLIKDIVERIAAAGKFAQIENKLTATAEYEIYLAQTLGRDFEEIRRDLRRLLKISNKQLDDIFTLAAKNTYEGQVKLFGTDFIPFEKNGGLQQIVRAAVDLADDDFKNITQTKGFKNLGAVDRNGVERKLFGAFSTNEKRKCYYQSVMDDVFNNVSTGAMPYNEAVRSACRAMADKGITVVEYESGVKTTLEAAVRRNIMGGLGLMVENISQYNHDSFGADGWEMSAHAMSAKDHEDFQGKQYTDAEWLKLNGTAEIPGLLKRRIGTLNCGHVAFPIIIGVNQPQYSPEQLEAFKTANAEGVTIDGKHYTMYEAAQRMRALERAIRAQKRQVIAANASGVDENIMEERAKLTNLKRKYAEFAKAAGLRPQEDRLYVVQGEFRGNKVA